MGTTGLRTSLIWHDEVMSDLVHEKPAKVTIGSSRDATFTTPDVGTVAAYAIVTPGRRGYLLTLSATMRGTICVGGIEHEVGAFVRAAEEPGGFRATPIGGNDWGVIELDDRGDHKLFFQFVPLEEAEWTLGHPMIQAAVGGFALSVAALTGLWWWKGVPLGEAAFRAGSLSSLAIGFAAIVRWVLKQDNESRASLAFSVMLHAAILFATFQLYDRGAPVDDLTRPTLAGAYKVDIGDYKEPPKVEMPKVKPTVVAAAAAAAAAAPKLPERHPWERPKGKKVTAPTVAIAADAKDHDETPAPGKVPGTRNQAPAVGLLVHEDLLHGIAGNTAGDDELDKFDQLGGGGKGGKTKKKGPPKAGGMNTRNGGTGNGVVGIAQQGNGVEPIAVRDAVCMGAGCGNGKGPTVLPPPEPPTEPGVPPLQKDEIERVMRAHEGLFGACYQKQLDRSSGLAGDMLMHFEIGRNGRVSGVRQTGGSMQNPAMRECMTRALGVLKFPERGGAIVNYPFTFSKQ